MDQTEMESNPILAGDPPLEANGQKLRSFLAWCPIAATATQVVPCAFFIALSGYRIAIGGLAVFAATCARPFEYYHQPTIRFTFYTIAIALSLLNLSMYFYARRQRLAPAARWRMRPLSARERFTQRIQLYSSLLTLAMIAGDILNHHLHGLS